MTRPPAGATTGEHIARFAAERPEAVALVNRGRIISYGELARDVRRFAGALREFDVPRGSMVAVGCDDIYVHWLLLLAFERLEVGTASFHGGDEAAEELLPHVHLALSEAPFAGTGTVRHRAITPAWVQAALMRPPEDGSSGDGGAPGDPLRLLRSSGTTGRPKHLLVTRGMNEPRLAVYARQYQFARGSRYLLTSPFSAGPVYGAATACLRAGGTVVSERFEGGAGAARAIVAHGITHVTLQPIMLKQLLDALPPDFAKPEALHVVTLGSALSDELCARALARLATEVTDVFGCNEVGGVSHRRATRREPFAEVSPEVTVEAVDESDRPVAAGTEGLLRIRTEGMVDGYLGEPELTARHFRNGWFYPGDRAVLDGPRRLRVAGRGGELLNIGGAKARPDDLEAIVMRHVSADDIGICALPNREGIEEIYVAVAGPRHEQSELLARVHRAFEQQQLGAFYVTVVRAIPRNAGGKIQRGVLREIVAAIAGRKPPG